MKIIFENFRLRREFKRSQLIHLTHFFFIMLALVIKLLIGHTGLIAFIVFFIFTAIYYRFFYLTAKKLYYTFWTFASLTLIFILGQMISTESNALFYCYGLALIFLVIEMSILSSPLYYPIVNWWDYDFRFRYDLKVKAKHKDDILDGRLTDLRRQAGCITLFDDLQVGTKIEVDLKLEGEPFQFELELMSKRQYSLGRPFHYGVRFKLTSEEKQEEYRKFLNHWGRRRKQKRIQKYEGTAGSGV